MPLMVHFHQVHSQLQSSLSELQARLNAIDVPVGGNMESIRSELRDAQVWNTLMRMSVCLAVDKLWKI